MTEAQERKERVVAELREVMPRYLERLGRIDERMVEYARDLVREDIDVHNEDELLGFRKFLRLLDTYEFDYDYVRDKIFFDAEGEWKKCVTADGTPYWEHQYWGFQIDGILGYQHYRQTPLQLLTYAWIYGFKTWVKTMAPNGSRAMLPSERYGEDGCIEDLRRLVRTFILLWPRKMAKTFTASYVATHEFIYGPRDAQVYIASNSADQSRTLWKMCDNFITQIPEWRRNFRRSDNDQHRHHKWREGNFRGSIGELIALSAGAKTKDGLKASAIFPDEFGAAKRVQGRASDMEGLINVLEGSQGPIREPLTMHSSTAGLALDSPYEMMITSTHELLLKEMEIPLDGQPHKTDMDWQGCILLRPDEWERQDEEALRSERVIKKVNPNLGITIQPDYYRNEWAKVDVDGEVKRKEVITKLYNVFRTDMAKQWVTGDKVRSLMRPLRIEDCTEDEGWQIFCGIDFALMADLNIVAMLARRRREDGRMQYHAGLRAYMSEDGIRQNTNKALLEKFVERGWLTVVKADDDFYMLPVRAIEELLDKGLCIVGVGYDPYKALKPINELKDYLFAEFGANDPKICEIVKPVRQSFANFNPLVIEMDYMINGEGGMDDDPMLTFEENGLWSWCAENLYLAESMDGMANRKPIKKAPDCKIDPWIGLLEGLCMADVSDGKIYDVAAE